MYVAEATKEPRHDNNDQHQAENALRPWQYNAHSTPSLAHLRLLRSIAMPGQGHSTLFRKTDGAISPQRNRRLG
jgi:hypothetical protein